MHSLYPSNCAQHTFYSVISEKAGDDSGAVEVENVELTVMDDISSSDSSSHATSHLGKDNSSSDEEGGDSSDSEEERYKILYTTFAVVNIWHAYTYM